MCLTIYAQRSRPTPLIAKEDIYAFKIMEVYNEGCDLTARVSSPYRGYDYDFGVEQRTVTIRPVRDYMSSWDINRGYHTYIDVKVAVAKLQRMKKTQSCHVSRSPYYLFVAVIPKGTKYYRGYFSTSADQPDSYASESLILLHRSDPRSMALIRNLPLNNAGKPVSF